MIDLTLRITKVDEWFVVICNEYEIVAQARTIQAALLEWGRIYDGRILVAKQLGIDPFERIRKRGHEATIANSMRNIGGIEIE